MGMSRIKAGQIVEDYPFQDSWYLSINYSAGPTFINVGCSWEIVAIKIVLSKMLLGMLVAIPHKGGIQWLSVGNPVEAIECRQVFFCQLLSECDEFGVRLFRFREDF